MPNYGRGVKAGVLAGVAGGVILGLGYYVLYSYVLTDIIRAAIRTNLPAGTTVDDAFVLAMWVVIASVFIGTIIAGVVLGAIFSATYDRYLRTSGAPMKGLVFGVMLWLVGVVLDIPDFYYGSTYIAVSAVVGLGGSLVFGYLLGRFYGDSQAKTALLTGTQAPTGKAT